MGIIRAAIGAIQGGLADQWLEVLEAGNMSDTTVLTSGVKVRSNDKRNRNVKGTDSLVTNGSVIHVYPNQFMMLVDGGKIIDYSAEPGYYKVDNATAPSLFNGEYGEAIKEAFTRIKYGGGAPYAQKVFFINTQEIKNIAFGTVNPVNYFDNFYNAELYLRAHGYFSIRIVDPIKFYAEAIPKNQDHVEITDIHKLYLSEFLTALQTAINQMSVDGIRISHVASKSMELAKYMSGILDSDWTQRRGMSIESVGINSISYDEESKKLINMRNQGAMLSDPTVREGYVQGAIARGLESAGSNANGAMSGFMGMGVGMQAGGGFMGAASQTNQYQMQQQNQQGGNQGYNQNNNNSSTPQQSAPAGEASGNEAWLCSCGASNQGRFCSNCGSKKPEAPAARNYRCSKCGWNPVDPKNPPKFCPNCGDPFNEGDVVS